MVTAHYLTEFLAGYLFCIFFRKTFQNFPRTGLLFFATGTLLVLAKSVYGGPVLEGTYYWGIPAILIVTGGLMMERSIRWHAYIIKLGDASYALYLTHSFVLALLAIIWYKLFPATLFSNVMFMTIALPATLVTAQLCHLIFEKPVTKFLNSKLSTKTRKTQELYTALNTDHSSFAK